MFGERRPRRARQTPSKSKIAARRKQLGYTQQQLADLTGIALRTIQRLDQGNAKDPTIRVLSNVALALRCELMDVVEDEWLQWTVFDQRVPAPPRPG